MNNYITLAKQYIKEKNYNEALKLARKIHGEDDVESYLTILDLLINKSYLPALEEKGIFYQYYDPTHDNGDYGEKYFDKDLKKQPHSINVLCDKAMSKFNKNKLHESLEYLDKVETNYSSYSKIENLLDEFRRKIIAIAAEEKNVEQVYRLNLQLFPLTKNVKERENEND